MSTRLAWSASSLAAGSATLTLHATLLALLLLPPSSPTRPNTEPSTIPVLPLIATVQLLDLERSAEELAVPSLQEVPVSLSAIRLPSPLLPESLVSDAFEAARAAESSVESTEIERLQGLYVGQIQSRLARVLEMASAPWPDAQIHCEARVIQNERGEVMEIDLADCALDASRRDQLAAAIRRASPFPAPPAQLAMGSSLTLDLSRL